MKRHQMGRRHNEALSRREEIRQRRMRTPPQPRDKSLLGVGLLAFGLWLSAIGPARAWASGAGIGEHWTFGVAPSFLAGFCFAHWQAFATRSRPIVAAAYAMALVALAEGVQLILPRYTADLWDMLAGIVGAGLAVPILQWRARRHLTPRGLASNS